MPRDTFSTQTPETLRTMAAELERISSQYRVAADSWESCQIERLEVKGEQERSRALKGASQFAQNALLSLWNELKKRKKFGEPIPPVSDSVSDSPSGESEE